MGMLVLGDIRGCSWIELDRSRCRRASHSFQSSLRLFVGLTPVLLPSSSSSSTMPICSEMAWLLRLDALLASDLRMMALLSSSSSCIRSTLLILRLLVNSLRDR